MSRSTGLNTMAAFFLPVLSLAIFSGVVCGNEATLTLRGRLTKVDVDYPEAVAPQRKGARREDSYYFLSVSDGSHWSLRFPEGSPLPSAGRALEIEVPVHQVPTSQDQDLSNSSSVRRTMASAESRARAQSGGISRPSNHSRRLGPMSNGHNPRQLQTTTSPDQPDDNRLTVISWRVLNTFELGLDPQSRSDQWDEFNSDFIYNTDKMIMDDVSTVIFILDMCGYGPAATKEELEKVLFHDDILSVQSYLTSCSNGIASFRPEHVLILGPVPVPCKYITSQDPPSNWSYISCNPEDMYAWHDYAESWARENGYGEVIWRYRHRVVLTSAQQTTWMNGGVDCSWSGMGTVGPLYDYDSSEYALYWPGMFGYVWINGDFWGEPQAWVHELGHNYFLGHAKVVDSEYGDSTCAMGLCCTPRCFNAPHMWFLGWADPVIFIDESELPPGRTISAMLPVSQPDPYAAPSVVSSSLAVLTTWINDQIIWVAYRETRRPFDNLPQELPRNVSIYVSFGPLPNKDQSTARLADLAPGSIWRSETYSLAVGWTGVFADEGGLTVQLKICRYLDFMQQEYRCWYDADGSKDGVFVHLHDPPSQLQSQPPLLPAEPALPAPRAASRNSPPLPSPPPPPSSPPPPSPSPPGMPASPLPPLSPQPPSAPHSPGLPSPQPPISETPSPSPPVPSQPHKPLTPSQPTPPSSPGLPSPAQSSPLSPAPQQPFPSLPNGPISPEKPAPPDTSPPLGPEPPNGPLSPPGLTAPFSFFQPVSPTSSSDPNQPLTPLSPSSPRRPAAAYTRDAPIGPLRPGPPQSPDKPSPMDNLPSVGAVSYPPTPSIPMSSGMVAAQPANPPTSTSDRQGDATPIPSAAMYPKEPTSFQHLHITREASPPVYGVLPAPDEYHGDS